MSVSPITDELIQEIDDPWISAYLRFAQRLERQLFATAAEVQEYISDVTGALPEPGHGAQIFITCDIAVRFPAEQTTLVVPDRSSPATMAALWVPRLA